MPENCILYDSKNVKLQTGDIVKYRGEFCQITRMGWEFIIQLIFVIELKFIHEPNSSLRIFARSFTIKFHDVTFVKKLRKSIEKITKWQKEGF